MDVRGKSDCIVFDAFKPQTYQLLSKILYLPSFTTLRQTMRGGGGGGGVQVYPGFNEKIMKVLSTKCHLSNMGHKYISASRLIDQLRWPSLQQRRKTTRLGSIYKIHHGLIQCLIIRSKLVPPPQRQHRAHNQQFCLINTRTQYRGGSFPPRTVRDWNHLPSEIVEAATADTFCVESLCPIVKTP